MLENTLEVIFILHRNRLSLVHLTRYFKRDEKITTKEMNFRPNFTHKSNYDDGQINCHKNSVV